MELTGRVLPITLGTIGFGVLIVILSGRPNYSKRWANILGRAGLTLLLNLIVLALVGLYLNAQNGFYGSWSDLFSSSAPIGVTTQHGGDPTAAAKLPVEGQGIHGSYQRTDERSPKRIEHFVFTGAKSHFHGEVYVRLPRGYDPKSPQQYSVIMGLHGLPGTPKAFFNLDGFMKDADQAEASGAMRKSIIIMPQLNSSAGEDSECLNEPKGAQIETWLSDDVPHWLVENFRASTHRTEWATWGYSFGGWCAAMLTMHHPDVFSGAVVFQGYYTPWWDGDKPAGITPEMVSRYDLTQLARRNPPAVSMWVFSSAQDSESYAPTLKFSDAARAPLSVTSVIAKRGGHRIDVWSPRIVDSFRWLGQNLPGFTAPVT